MPTSDEIEAALDAMMPEQDWRSAPGGEADEWRSDMAAALTAAEKVREEEQARLMERTGGKRGSLSEREVAIYDEAYTAGREAAGQPIETIHTCHAKCPCQTGGEPVSDFLEAAQPVRHSGEPIAQEADKSHEPKHETGQPIPDEPEALVRISHSAYAAGQADTLAKVRERVEAERLALDRPELLTAEGLEQDKAYNRAIADALTAIDEEAGDE
jgi:hypothetical protein